MDRDDVIRQPWTTPQLRSSEAETTALSAGIVSDGTEGTSIPFSVT